MTNTIKGVHSQNIAFVTDVQHIRTTISTFIARRIALIPVCCRLGFVCFMSLRCCFINVYLTTMLICFFFVSELMFYKVYTAVAFFVIVL